LQKSPLFIMASVSRLVLFGQCTLLALAEANLNALSGDGPLRRRAIGRAAPLAPLEAVASWKDRPWTWLSCSLNVAEHRISDSRGERRSKGGRGPSCSADGPGDRQFQRACPAADSPSQLGRPKMRRDNTDRIPWSPPPTHPHLPRHGIRPGQASAAAAGTPRPPSERPARHAWPVPRRAAAASAVRSGPAQPTSIVCPNVPSSPMGEGLMQPRQLGVAPRQFCPQIGPP
jgi:hypothetical protein